MRCECQSTRVFTESSLGRTMKKGFGLVKVADSPAWSVTLTSIL